MQSITKVIPTVHIDMTRWQHLNGLELADTQFGIPSNIDILIGADVWGKAVEGDIRLGGLNEPHAQRTRFGWVVFGPVPAAQPATPPTLSFNTQQGEEDAHLEELVRSFWKLEEVPSQDCNGEDECEKIFLTTHSRTRDGRYMVHIPFHPDAPALGNSYAHALRQFHLLERRLAANCELKKKYIAFMREYADLGHMEPVSHILHPSPRGSGKVPRCVQCFSADHERPLTERRPVGGSHDSRTTCKYHLSFSVFSRSINSRHRENVPSNSDNSRT